jgi:hypothetical protein
MSDFKEILSELYASKYRQSFSNNTVDTRTCELGTTLARLNVLKLIMEVKLEKYAASVKVTFCKM